MINILLLREKLLPIWHYCFMTFVRIITILQRTTYGPIQYNILFCEITATGLKKLLTYIHIPQALLC